MAAGAWAVGWVAGMPWWFTAVLCVVLQLVAALPALASYRRDVLVERERTRCHELAWQNAPAVQQAGGDAAAVARGLQGTAGRTEAADSDAPRRVGSG